MRKVRLLLLIFLLPLAVLSAQEEDGGVEVMVIYPKENPVVGTTWTLTLFIDHSEPDEVTVIAPSLNDRIFFDRMMKSPGVEGEENPLYQRWTVAEFNFTFNRPGNVSFGSFTVITPQGEVKTKPFDINIVRPLGTVEKTVYRVSWQGVPAEMKIGESTVINLSFYGLNQATPAGSIPLPEYGQFIPTVPQGHIVEIIPLSPEERRTGLTLKIRIIPATATPFTMDRRSITHGNTIFEIPSLRIPVARPAPTTANANAAVPAETSPPENADANVIAASRIPAFPSTGNAAFVNNRLYTRHRAECENIFNTAKNLWETGNLTDALVTLRRNERDHSAGKLIAVIRREAERVLGFYGTNDEKKNNPLFFWRTQPQTAVVKETTVRRIPDPDGAEITRFREGRPVLVYSNTDGRNVFWLRVVTNDSAGVSGWVPKENIILY